MGRCCTVLLIATDADVKRIYRFRPTGTIHSHRLGVRRRVAPSRQNKRKKRTATNLKYSARRRTEGSADSRSLRALAVSSLSVK